MRLRRFITLALAVVAAASAPSAGSGAGVDLFSQAAADLEREVALLPLARPGAPDAIAGRDDLRRIDAEGAATLQAIRRTGIPVSVNVERTLGLLAPPGGTPAPPPAREIYLDAIDELRQLARRHPGLSAPVAPVPPGPQATGSSVGMTLAIGGGIVALMVGLSSIVWARRRVNAHQLVAMAHTDALTGVANRHRLDDDVRSLAGGPGEAVAVLMVDVDHFKRVNDEHGHGTGDEVLRRVAAVIAAAVRPDDVVYRYGGEEFSVVLRSTPRAYARTVADRVRALIASSDMPVPGGITVSVGLAAGRSAEIETLFERADRALYRSKHAGRDLVTEWTERIEAPEAALEPAP